MLILRNKVWVIVLYGIYQLLVLSLSMWTRHWLQGLILHLLLLLRLTSLYNLFTVSQPVRIPLYQILFVIILLLIWALSFEGCDIQIIFFELMLMRAVFIQHHLELLNLLKTTLSHYWRQLSQIRHVIGVHRENLGLGGWLHEVVSLLLGVWIRFKVSDVL